MTTVVLALHLIVTAVLIFLILLQKSEGSAAGGGFGGGVSLSAMMQPRSRPNALTRATSILAITFFGTSITLALLAKDRAPATSILAPAASSSGTAPKVSESVIETPAVPSVEEPAAAPAVPGGAPPAAPAVPSAPN